MKYRTLACSECDSTWMQLIVQGSRPALTCSDVCKRTRANRLDRERRDSPPKNRMGVLPCSVNGCDRFYYAKGYCDLHYNRARLNGGDPGPPKPKKRTRTDRHTNRGYVYLTLRDERGNKTGRRAEHRFVMEQVLGRPLRDFENVHHINGIRDDNRPENLELWTKPQQSGQRARDLAEWVVETYPSLVEAALSDRRQLRLVNE